MQWKGGRNRYFSILFFHCQVKECGSYTMHTALHGRQTWDTSSITQRFSPSKRKSELGQIPKIYRDLAHNVHGQSQMIEKRLIESIDRLFKRQEAFCDVQQRHHVTVSRTSAALIHSIRSSSIFICSYYVSPLVWVYGYLQAIKRNKREMYRSDCDASSCHAKQTIWRRGKCSTQEFDCFIDTLNCFC